MKEAVTPSEKAVIVVDLQKDNVGGFCRAIIPNIKLLLREARGKGIPIIFACDSRYPDDFIFTERASTAHYPGNRGGEGHR